MKVLLLLISLQIALSATLSVAKGQDDTCKCSGVILLTKDELAKEIKKQVDEALSTSPTPIESKAMCNIQGVANVTSEIDKLYDRVKELVNPIADKLSYLYVEQPGLCAGHPANSCKEILEYDQNTPSGYYWLKPTKGKPVQRYCDMTRTCGGITGGWMKVTELDMTCGQQQCPDPLRSAVRNGTRVCESPLVNEGGCASVNYQTNGIGYVEVCGKIIGYQKGSTDGVWAGLFEGVSIDGPYVDGVSLTHGTPRQHVWSFISALHEDGDDEQVPNRRLYTCFCANRNNRGPNPPSFVGQDYFCDTAVAQYSGHDLYYMDDPLWDGAGCGPTNECCTFHNPPWFYKKLSRGTNDDIEMRVCRDSPPSNEDVLIEKVDIYVR